MKIREILEEFFRSCGISCSKRELLFKLKRLQLFSRYCRASGFKQGIISDKDKINLIKRHIIDSLLILKISSFKSIFKEKKKIIDAADFGTGGGFPGLVLALVLNNVNFYLFDSQKRRIKYIKNFLTHLENSLYDISKNNNIHLECKRVEDNRSIDQYKNKFTFITSRAFYNVGVSLELIFPYLKEQNGFYFYYGGKINNINIDVLKSKIKNTDYQLHKIEKIYYTNLNAERCFIILKKIGITPEYWPRKLKRIIKEPF
jgi:16S rRNA (guanine527-N7)-methyltransferase